MEMHAYSEDYLLTAQRILGDMLDYAVNEYEFDKTDQGENEDGIWKFTFTIKKAVTPLSLRQAQTKG